MNVPTGRRRIRERVVTSLAQTFSSSFEAFRQQSPLSNIF